MEPFLEGSTALRPLQVNSEEEIYICYSSHLGVLMEQFLEGNVPLRHLLNEKTLLMSWQRSAIKEVNDWDLNGIWHKEQNLGSELFSIFVVFGSSSFEIFSLIFWSNLSFFFFGMGDFVRDFLTGCFFLFLLLEEGPALFLKSQKSLGEETKSSSLSEVKTILNFRENNLFQKYISDIIFRNFFQIFSWFFLFT